MTTNYEDQEFAKVLHEDLELTSYALANAIRWIGENLSPDEVFSDNKLNSWAESNGWVAEE